MSKWTKVEDEKPELCTHVRVFHPEWKDEFTPTGTREATYIDEGFLISRWMPDQDQWEVMYAEPTHWTYPDLPEGEEPWSCS